MPPVIKATLHGTWLLRKRDGQVNPPVAVRYFKGNFYRWDDHGREQVTQKGRYKIRETVLTATHDKVTETFNVNIVQGELQIQQMTPKVGRLAIYRRQ